MKAPSGSRYRQQAGRRSLIHRLLRDRIKTFMAVVSPSSLAIMGPFIFRLRPVNIFCCTIRESHPLNQLIVYNFPFSLPEQTFLSSRCSDARVIFFQSNRALPALMAVAPTQCRANRIHSSCSTLRAFATILIMTICFVCLGLQLMANIGSLLQTYMASSFANHEDLFFRDETRFLNQRKM